MKHVGIFEAKTNLSSLIEEVEKGGEIVITRHGKPVARLVSERKDKPFTPEQVAERRKALMKLREFGRSLNITATQEEIKSWINEGRR